MAYKNKQKTIAYNNEFIAKTYDRVNLTIPKGEKDILKSHSQTHRESVNGFIKRAIAETIERDNSKNLK